MTIPDLLQHRLPAPDTWRVLSSEDILLLNRKLLVRDNLTNNNLVMGGGSRSANNKKYVLKNIGYDPVHRLDMFTLPKKDEQVTSRCEFLKI